VFPADRRTFLLGFDCEIPEIEAAKLVGSGSFAGRSAGLLGEVFGGW
jgi:hypothetical protein